MAKEDLEYLDEGDRVSATQWNLRTDILKRSDTGPACWVDETGVYHRPLAPKGIQQRFFKLNDAFTTGSTVEASWWDFDADGELVDTDEDFDVTDCWNWWDDSDEDTKGIAQWEPGADAWNIIDLDVCAT